MPQTTRITPQRSLEAPSTKAMRAIRWSKGGLVLVETPKPTELSADDVVVRVAYSGICGSDMHFIRKEMTSVADGVILGHEIVGIIDTVGKAVNRLKVGDKVAVDPNYFCGSCAWCRQGKVFYCEPGSLRDFLGLARDGGWADYVKVSEHQVEKIPDGMSLKQASLIEPLSCILHAYKNHPMSSDSRVLVMGMGMIGLLWASLFKHYGFSNVTLTEVAEGRKKIAQDCGLNFKIYKPEDLAAQFKEPGVAERSGFDLIVDTTGKADALEKALEWLRRGGKYSLFGLVPEKDTVRIKPLELTMKDNSIITSVLSGTSFIQAMNVLSDMYRSGVDIENLGLQWFPLEEYEEAISTLEKYAISKAVFCVSEAD